MMGKVAFYGFFDVEHGWQFLKTLNKEMVSVYESNIEFIES